MSFLRHEEIYPTMRAEIDLDRADDLIDALPRLLSYDFQVRLGNRHAVDFVLLGRPDVDFEFVGDGLEMIQLPVGLPDTLALLALQFQADGAGKASWGMKTLKCCAPPCLCRRLAAKWRSGRKSWCPK